MSDAADGFLSRWSRRKAAVKGGRQPPDEPLPAAPAALVEAPAVVPTLPADPAADAPAEPLRRSTTWRRCGPATRCRASSRAASTRTSSARR
ncbi:hypothetical protein [Methylibium sp. T29]|uniref:hypothetical protein n=1 Tax=Methylibium sp. T29 TaxID=1430884 RepID=UPI0003F3F485|nr:hypothetical protein [Methylibium sp. T29]EWS53109.1 hypothetical protein X551_04097 [Methylibium sp. T29]